MVAALATSTDAPSFWLQTCGDDLRPRPALPGDRSCDVAIVGAGYTGLWTAYHLLRRDPRLRVTVLERRIAGWGASGRNGGWCSALFATGWTQLSQRYGWDSAIRLRRALERTVDDVGAWCERFEINAHWVKGGTLTLARGGAQVSRLSAELTEDRQHGGDDTRWLDAGQTRELLDASGVDGALFTPHCAAIQPARLARGLARVVESMGATIHEHTEVTALHRGACDTDAGRLRADVVVRATEAYTAGLTGQHR